MCLCRFGRFWPGFAFVCKGFWFVQWSLRIRSSWRGAQQRGRDNAQWVAWRAGPRPALVDGDWAAVSFAGPPSPVIEGRQRRLRSEQGCLRRPEHRGAADRAGRSGSSWQMTRPNRAAQSRGTAASAPAARRPSLGEPIFGCGWRRTRSCWVTRKQKEGDEGVEGGQEVDGNSPRHSAEVR
jgi:hypothetical protein